MLTDRYMIFDIFLGLITDRVIWINSLFGIVISLHEIDEITKILLTLVIIVYTLYRTIKLANEGQDRRERRRAKKEEIFNNGMDDK